MSIGNTICWTDIPVEDLDRAIRFYSAVLGKPVEKQSAGGRFEFGLLPHADQNVSGALSKVPDNRPSQSGPLVYLSTEGRLDDAARAAEANGGRILQPKQSIGPHGHRVILLDSEGNRIALHSHTP